MSEQTPSADVVLHAERVDVALHSVPRERVRVRREIITEDVTVTVTVRREVLRLERIPLLTSEGPSEAGAVAGAPHGTGTQAGPDTLEVVLSAERPVVSLEVVPYERVRLGVRSVASATPVTVDVRREVVDITHTASMAQNDQRDPVNVSSAVLDSRA